MHSLLPGELPIMSLDAFSAISVALLVAFSNSDSEKQYYYDGSVCTTTLVAPV